MACLCEEPDGDGQIEAWTVMHDREGQPERAICTALLPDGRRAWGVSTEPSVTKAMVSEDVAGRTVALRPDGELELR